MVYNESMIGSERFFLASVTQQNIHFLLLREKRGGFVLEHASHLSLPEAEDDFSHYTDEKVQKDIRTHLATFPHPKKIHLILPHHYFAFLFAQKPKKRMGKKRIRTFLVDLLKKEGKEDLLTYGFEYELLSRADEPTFAFRLLPREAFQMLERSFKKIGLKVLSFHSDLSQYWSTLREQCELPFTHFHFGGDYSSFSVHSSKPPYITREHYFSISRSALFKVYAQLSIADEEFEETLRTEGFFLGSDSEVYPQSLKELIDPLTQFFFSSAFKGRMYVTSEGTLPKYLVYLLERHTSSQVIPVCFLDEIREKKLLDGILHLHKEKDGQFAPLILRAFHLKKNR